MTEMEDHVKLKKMFVAKGSRKREWNMLKMRLKCQTNGVLRYLWDKTPITDNY